MVIFIDKLIMMNLHLEYNLKYLTYAIVNY